MTRTTRHAIYPTSASHSPERYNDARRDIESILRLSLCECEQQLRGVVHRRHHHGGHFEILERMLPGVLLGTAEVLDVSRLEEVARGVPRVGVVHGERTVLGKVREPDEAVGCRGAASPVPGVDVGRERLNAKVGVVVTWEGMRNGM